MVEEFEKPNALTKAERTQFAELMNQPKLSAEEKREVRILLIKMFGEAESKSVAKRLLIQRG